jgi:hypothetical protein
MSIISKKMFVVATVVALSAAGFATTASARLPSQSSQGHGVKCYFVPVVQADGTVVHNQICVRGV